MECTRAVGLNDETAERIRALGLKPHPEGGFYRCTFTSDLSLTYGNPAGQDRSIATAILYLLPAGDVSRIHRIDSDEMWHFYHGQPLTIVELKTGSVHTETILGRNSGQVCQNLVPRGVWFGAFSSTASYSLVGCTVFPGYDFDNFEIGSRDFLRIQFPESEAIIEKLGAQ